MYSGEIVTAIKAWSLGTDYKGLDHKLAWLTVTKDSVSAVNNTVLCLQEGQLPRGVDSLPVFRPSDRWVFYFILLNIQLKDV